MEEKAKLYHDKVKKGLFLVIIDGFVLIGATIFNLVFDASGIIFFRFLYRSLLIASSVIGLVAVYYCMSSGSVRFKKSGIFRLVGLGCSILSLAIPESRFLSLTILASDLCHTFFVSNFIKGCGEVTYSPVVKKLQKFVSLSRLSATIVNFVPTLMTVFNYENRAMFITFSVIVFLIRLAHYITFVILLFAAHKTVK